MKKNHGCTGRFGRGAVGSHPKCFFSRLLEDKDHVYVEALTPGVDPQSINLTAMQNRLNLAGEKSGIPGDIKPEAFHRNERASGKFVRTIDLPVEIDETGIQAEYKNGLLVVTLPKAEKAKPKQISVKIA